MGYIKDIFGFALRMALVHLFAFFLLVMAVLHADSWWDSMYSSATDLWQFFIARIADLGNMWDWKEGAPFGRIMALSVDGGSMLVHLTLSWMSALLLALAVWLTIKLLWKRLAERRARVWKRRFAARVMSVIIALGMIVGLFIYAPQVLSSILDFSRAIWDQVGSWLAAHTDFGRWDGQVEYLLQGSSLGEQVVMTYLLIVGIYLFVRPFFFQQREPELPTPA